MAFNKDVGAHMLLCYSTFCFSERTIFFSVQAQVDIWKLSLPFFFSRMKSTVSSSSEEKGTETITHRLERLYVCDPEPSNIRT